MSLSFQDPDETSLPPSPVAEEPAAPASILVVDDAPADSLVLAAVLTRQGYMVRVENDSTQAFSAVQADPPDLIMLDILMPKMSGFQVCEQLKSDERTRDIPVVFVSGLGEPEDKERAFAVGGVDYITKPFQVREVLSRVTTHLALRNLQKRLMDKNAQLERQIVERQRREETTRNHAERLKILNEINQSILAARSPATIVVAAVGRMRQLIPCQRVMALERTREGRVEMLAAESSSEFGLQADLGLRQRVFEEPALRGGHVLGAADLQGLASRSPMQQALYEEGIRSYIIVPILSQGEPIGTLHMEARQPMAFTAEHVNIAIEVATLLAVAIRQVRLYELAQQEIAERQEAERVLRQYTIELEMRNTELDAFAHTVAHDLKTPLTSLVGFSMLLQSRYSRLKEEQVLNGLHVITQNGQKMVSIIDELLLLASVRKMDDVPISPLDMAGIVDQVEGRLIAIVEEFQAEIVLPSTWPVALGYGPWVEEIWANYISNAIKYGGTPPRVELGADRQPPDEGAGPQIRFWVRDNGPGIAPEEQKRLFTLFTRLDQARARGHGLGLSIVQRIAAKLGGQVGVESTLEQGSTFWFTLAEAEPGTDG